MGNTISGIIKGLDKADEKQAEAKEALQIMHQMADDILMHFYDNIEFVFPLISISPFYC